jgi:prophage maintenance system killer protein
MEDFRSYSMDELVSLASEINKQLTKRTGEPFGIYSQSGLESAVGQLLQGWYSDEEALASAFKSLILNHTFINGNKRTAVVLIQYFKDTVLTENQLYDLTMKIANPGGGQISKEEISNFLYGTKYPVAKPLIKELSDKPIPETGWDFQTRDSIWKELDEIED